MNPWELDIGKYQPTHVRIVYTWQCGICGAKHDEEWHGTTLTLPGPPPEGWKQIARNGWVCPKHKVRLEIDDEQLPNPFGR